MYIHTYVHSTRTYAHTKVVLVSTKDLRVADSSSTATNTQYTSMSSVLVHIASAMASTCRCNTLKQSSIAIESIHAYTLHISL
jgi:predicted regulator of Ras-like GTPase activity (Roadblock/LC7/MglB family)